MDAYRVVSSAIPAQNDRTAPRTPHRCPVTGHSSHRSTATAETLYGPADPEEAEAFLRLFHNEHPEQPTSLRARLREVQSQIARTGSYRHTTAELTFGAQVAWRNSSRCIGRLYWQSLQVNDRREVRDPASIHHYLTDHLRQATNSGRIRPVISIFGQAVPRRPYARVWNEQLIRYAGYPCADGSTLGDPRTIEFTAAVQRMGWTGRGTPFDVLPLVIDVPDHKPQLFDLPRDAVLEVDITHPIYGWFAELGLRWHAIPAISNMRLEIGGLHYPLAPFNGWYMGTEIGARNFADADRYNLLPLVARRLGLDTSRESSLWRDRALVELNLAVLHSFENAGVKVADHHTESRRFLTHLEKEERAGRTVPADWSWIVPPISGGATPVFHRYYDEADLKPNFYLDDHAVALAREGGRST